MPRMTDEVRLLLVIVRAERLMKQILQADLDKARDENERLRKELDCAAR